MSDLDDLPGRIVVMAPADAVQAFDHAPEQRDRVYTMPGLATGTAYVLDVDAFRRRIDETVFDIRTSSSERP